ncbi:MULTISPECIES: class II aldolase/adducin family protein [Euryhalocaulis]|uniref:class II aldolase/adducin family protein n=1 Tax=Euryhalocaulis TaxID=1712422 RepID=UPI00039E2ABA|nr:MULTISPECIES: class II aldolase/adducin family protein [Euryhalocaulis]MBA4801280.1 class II aldolase/adducin family protein [Euryhalocaulis sp.]
MALAAENDETPVREQVSEEEWKARVDLAALYRLVRMHGWDDLFFTHISMRVPGPEEHFLLNPFGLLYEDVTASNLVKVDLEGNVLPPSKYGINPAGFTIHSAIHAAREDVHVALHLHSDAGVAVAAQKDGLLPISQLAMNIMSDVSYHDYEGLALVEDEKARLVADLGEKNTMILRNHGTLSVGSHPFQAYLRIYILERACKIQTMAQSGGAELVQWDKGMQDKVFKQGEEGILNEFFLEIAWAALLDRVRRESPGFDV